MWRGEGSVGGVGSEWDNVGRVYRCVGFVEGVGSVGEGVVMCRGECRACEGLWGRMWEQCEYSEVCTWPSPPPL